MNRRDFLKLTVITSGGLVATATMAEAGFFADFLSWIKRRPVWSIPSTLNVLTAEKISVAVKQLSTYTVGQNAFYGPIHPFLVHDILADDMLPELIHPLDINYEFKMVSSARKAEMDAEFNRNGGLVGVWNKIDEHDKRIHAAPTWQADKDTLCYTKNDKYETCRVVYNKTTNKIDLLPTTSLAFNT